MDRTVCLQCLYVKTLVSNVTILGDRAFKEVAKIKWGFPGGASDKESTCQCRRCKRWGFHPWVGKTCWRRDKLPTPVFLGFPGGSAGKESTCNAGELGSISGFDLWVGKIPWRRERLSTPVFWPGELYGLYSPWGSKESDTTERLSALLFFRARTQE